MPTEAWLRGPIDGVPALLQPVAHALVQSRDELSAACSGLDAEGLRARPGGAASVDFHLRHIAGSIDRLLTYARGEALSEEQRLAATSEGADSGQDAAALLDGVSAAVESALAQVRVTPEASLVEARAVGRGRLPSTVIGLLFHVAEHTARHTGQVIATAKAARPVAGTR
jgi:uncharacterized damage-inducible protein DinB